MAIVQQELISSPEVAKRLGCSLATVARLARSGKLPFAHKVPGKRGAYLFDPDVIDQFARERLDEARQVVAAIQDGLADSEDAG